MASQWKGVLGSGGIAVLLYLSGLLLWLTPIPLIYTYRKRGSQEALVAGGFGLFLLGILYLALLPWVISQFGAEKLGPYFFWLPGVGVAQGATWNPAWFGLPYFAFYGVMAWMLGHWESREKDITLLVGRTLGVLLAGIIIWVLWQTGGALSQVVPETEKYFRALLEQIIQVPKEGGPEVRDQLALFHTYGDRIIYYAVRLIPGMVISMTLFVIWLNVLVARKIFLKDKFFGILGPLKKWQLPFSFVWALIGVASLLIADIYFFKIGYFKILALNVFIVFGLVYTFQGLAILAFFSQKWKIPPLAKLVFYLLFLLFFQPISVLLLGLGFFDSWFDIRKLTPKAARP